MSSKKKSGGWNYRELPPVVENIDQEEIERFLPFVMLLLGVFILGLAIDSSLRGQIYHSIVFYAVGISSLILYIILTLFSTLRIVSWAFTLVLAVLFYHLFLNPDIDHYTGLFGCLAITPAFVAALGWRRGSIILLAILCSIFIIIYSGLNDFVILNYPDKVVGRFIVCFIGLSAYTVALDYSRHISFGRLVRMMDQYKRVIRNDPLTGVHNRQELKRILRREHFKLIRTGCGFFLALVDVDNFKHYNRRYGSGIGDRVLQMVGNVLHESLRSDDFVARWGSDEFLIFLEGDKLPEAVKIIERIKVRLAELELNVGNESIFVTTSVGLVPMANKGDLDEVINQLERKLRAAQQQGHNQMITLA